MFCQHCGQEFDENTLFCPFCGKEINLTITKNKISENENNIILKKKTSPIAVGCAIFGCIALFIFIILPFIIGNDDNTKITYSKSYNCPSELETFDAIKQYKDSKIISKIEPSLNSVYITTFVQNQLNIDDLTTLGYISACYSANYKSTNIIWSDIYNYNTGRKVAHYSKTYGLKMEK